VRGLPFAHGGPPLRGRLRAVPEDFEVDECLGFTPDGQGEHLFLRIEKRGANTEWVARQLAVALRVAPMAVSFSGLKDRHAVTQLSKLRLLEAQAWMAVEAAMAGYEVTVIDPRRAFATTERLPGVRSWLEKVAGQVGGPQKRSSCLGSAQACQRRSTGTG